MADQRTGGGPHWPDRLAQLLRLLPDATRAASEREGILEEAWLILSSALQHYLRLHASRLGQISKEDVEDIASDKALGLLRRIESGRENPARRGRHGLAGYVSTVARNGLVDLLRSRNREVVEDGSNRIESEREAETVETMRPAVADPRLPLARKRFAQALRLCAERLQPRNARIWFLRVFYEMTSREIASHPGVRLRADHVDVLLQRSRNAIRDCMRRKGIEPADMPPGAFTELWKVFGPVLLSHKERIR